MSKRIHKLLNLICENCGKSFSVSEGAKSSTRFCCQACRKLFTIKKNTKICMECKRPFVTDYKQQVFCSKECHINYTRKQNTHECDYCHKKFIESHQEGKKHFFCCAEHYRLYREEHKKTYVCEQCHKKFHRISRNHDAYRFCSRECSKQYIHEHKQIKIKTKKLLFLTCTICGKDFLSKHNRECCSKECAYKLQKTRDFLRRREKYKPFRSTCKNCHKEYIVQFKQSKYFCCDNCRQEYMKDNHHYIVKSRLIGKVKEQGVNLNALIERDHGICKLCGKPVDSSDYVERNGAFIACAYYPSIDHIKPLDKGGLHEWSNVQLAHHICNSRKRDRY